MASRTNRPRVSVVMPVFNAEKYLRESIESILHQTLANFEFIIVNDYSTDNSKKIIAGFSDSRIIYLENEKKMGVTKSLNRGLSKASGTYVARMDADD